MVKAAFSKCEIQIINKSVVLSQKRTPEKQITDF